jgi:Rrf2 family protein
MLTKRAKYALQALVYLARDYGHGPVLIADIAEKEQIPQKFLELILLELKNAGILVSKKGKGGGYTLAKPPREITFGQIIRQIDGPLAPVPCVSVTAYQSCDECLDEELCGIRIVMKDVRDAISLILDNVSLADVLERIEVITTQRQGISMYFI